MALRLRAASALQVGREPLSSLLSKRLLQVVVHTHVGDRASEPVTLEVQPTDTVLHVKELLEDAKGGTGCAEAHPRLQEFCLGCFFIAAAGLS